MSLERVSALEEELTAANQEVKSSLLIDTIFFRLISIYFFNLSDLFYPNVMLIFSFPHYISVPCLWPHN